MPRFTLFQLMRSQITESIDYSNQKIIQTDKSLIILSYLTKVKAHALIVIDQLMRLVMLVWPKVITLRCVHCINLLKFILFFKNFIFQFIHSFIFHLILHSFLINFMFHTFHFLIKLSDMVDHKNSTTVKKTYLITSLM